jgi:transcription factor C subunit 6
LAGKQAKVNVLFGPTVSDYTPVIKATNKWIHEATFPERRNATKSGDGGCQYSMWQGGAGRAQEAEHSWDWYFKDGGREAFSDRQTTSKLEQEAANEYVPGSNAPEKAVLLGPVGSPKLFKLHTSQATSLREGWTGDKPNTSASAKSGKGTRAGFVLNLGAKVRCLDWAPNREGGSQHLAVSTNPTRETGKDGAPVGASPAFSPQIACASSTQIWRFKTSQKCSVDMSEPPLLTAVLCTNWGDAKALKWCPAPRQPADTQQNLGLLAGVWGDGGLRVLDLADSPEASSTEYLRVDRAAFEAHPPNTVFTCLSWLSSTRIGAGCANGCVAVFDVSKSLLSPNTTTVIRPLIYTHLAVGYILSIAACYPSLRRAMSWLSE